MTAKRVYRAIYRELSRQHNIAAKLHLEKDLQKIEALAKYQRLKNAAAGIKSDPAQLQKDLENQKNSVVKRYDSGTLRSFFKELLSNSEAGKELDFEFARSVALFLKSQRTYKELLELYNGSTIDDEKRLHLSARRVGLELPEQK